MAEIVYAQTDADIVIIHRFLCVIAQPVLFCPIDASKSISEINRLVKDPSAGFILMAIHEERLVGTLGVAMVDWWYGHANFLTDRFFFVIESMRQAGVGPALESEAAAVANDLDVPLIINGKMRRKGATPVFHTLPRTHDGN